MHWRIVTLMLVSILAMNGAAEARKPKVFLCCETYSLRDYMKRGDYDCISVMKLMKELGIKGVSINDIYMKSQDKAYLDQIKDAAKRNDIIIAAYVVDGSVISNNEASRKREIEYSKERMHTAAYLGAYVIRINIGGLGDSARDDTVGVDQAISSLNELLPQAKELDLKMVLENHGGVTGKADNIVKIIKATDPKYVGSCPDFMNWPKGDYYTELAKVIPYAYHVHAKAHNFDANGEETVVSYDRILKMLKDSKYSGAVSIEYEGTSDQIEGIKKTRDLIFKYWKM